MHLSSSYQRPNLNLLYYSLFISPSLSLCTSGPSPLYNTVFSPPFFSLSLNKHKQLYFFSNPQRSRKESVLGFTYIPNLCKKFKRKCHLAGGRDKQAHHRGLAMIRSLILSQSSDNLFQRFARTVVPAR